MAQRTEHNQFQKDIENKAVVAWQQKLKLTAELAACTQQLSEMFKSCPWLDAGAIERRAANREKQDTDATGPRRGGVRV